MKALLIIIVSAFATFANAQPFQCLDGMTYAGGFVTCHRPLFNHAGKSYPIYAEMFYNRRTGQARVEVTPICQAFNGSDYGLVSISEGGLPKYSVYFNDQAQVSGFKLTASYIEVLQCEAQ